MTTDDNRVLAKCEGGMDAVLLLFANASPMTASHWNVLTGATFAVRNSRRSRAAVEAFEERLFEEDGWHEVPFQESDDAFAMMNEFADSLRPGKGRTALRNALSDDKPFRRFRAELGRFAGIARRYRELVAEESAARLVVFCLANDLTLDDPRFAKLSRQLQKQLIESELKAAVVPPTSLSLGSKRPRPRAGDDASALLHSFDPDPSAPTA
mgnify:CR=1 FL=1